MAFTIGKNGSYLERVSFDGFDISLLSKGDGAEIMLQSIKKNKIFYLYPSDNKGVMEFVYILQGEMVCEIDGEKIRLGPQDYYSATDLKETIHFTALTDVVFLWVITEPTFYHLSQSLVSLKETVDEVEKKDRYTYKHSERVTEYSIKIANKLMLSKDKLENLYIASLLHDIGKINTPEEILNKPGKLTNEEYDLIKLHPTDGANMVKELYYGEISTIIEQHHERLNGSGYPYGLKGDSIVLEARIIAVSDSFDAMTEERAYRKALDAKTAINELKRLVDTHYDQTIVNVFEEILLEEGRI